MNVILTTHDKYSFALLVGRKIHSVLASVLGLTCDSTNSILQHQRMKSPTGHISVKFNTGDLHKNLLRNSKFGYHQAKIFGALSEDIRDFIVAGNVKSP